MKRFLIISALLGLFFASCSYDASDTSQTGTKSKQKNEEQKLQLFSFVLDEDFVTQIRQESGITDSNSVTVRIEFTGGYEATDTKTLRFSELEGAAFSFSEIPLNTPFTISVSVYHGSVLKYETKKEDVVLTKGGKNDLSLLLKSVFEFADETKYILWNGHQCYTAKTPDGSLTPLSDQPNIEPFFDAAGNVWYYSLSEGYEKAKLVSDNGKEFDLPFNAENPDSILYRAFACARELNILYAVGVQSSDGESVEGKNVVTKFPSALTSLSRKNSKTYNLSFPEAYHEFTLNGKYKYTVFNDGKNDKMYTLCLDMSSETSEIHIVEFDFNKADAENVVTCEDKLNISEYLPDGFNYYSLVDMICHNGTLYFILDDSYLGSSWTKGEEIHSRGALLKCTFVSGSASVEIKGLGTDNILNTDIANMYCFASNGAVAYANAEYSELLKVEGSEYFNSSEKYSSLFPTIKSPEAKFIDSKLILSSNFYGPKKFVALKPKKLVIADDGYAFYMDADNALSYKNVNRIVTVDLESFAMKAVDVSVTFDFDQNSDLKMESNLGACGSDFSSGKTPYFKSGSFDMVNCFLGIKNADSN